MPWRQKTSSRRVEPRLKMSCQTLVSCASNPEAKDSVTAARSSIPSWPAWFAVRADDRVHVAEAEAQDVDVVDGVLNQAPAAGLGDVGPPLRGVGALNREVLVVAEHAGHRRTQRPALHQVAQRPEHRRAAQHQAALAGHAGRAATASTSCRGAGQVHVERLLAEHGAPGGKRLVHRAPMRRRRRADPDGIAAPGHLCGVADHGHVAVAQGLGEAAGTALTPVVDGDDRRIDDTPVDHRLEAQAVGPGDEAGPDEADAQHARDTRR